MTLLIFLDDYHVGDPLFLADLGRRLSKLGSEGRTVIVHRANEAVSRALEDSDSGDRDVITERTIRETNQGIARRLTEEGAPAVSIQGSDRGLLRISDAVQASKATWLLKMIETGSIPVISPLALGENGIAHINPAQCVVAIAAAAGAAGSRDVCAVLFTVTRKGGLFRGGARLESVPASDLDDHIETVDVEAARGLVVAVDRLYVTNSAGLVGELSVKGTLVTA